MNIIRLSTAVLVGMVSILNLAPSQAKSLPNLKLRNNPMYSISHDRQLNKAEIAWKWKPKSALPFRYTGKSVPMTIAEYHPEITA